ncbi:unnamed protein product [Polarella glacialis]|uniref:Uncharacterized protein n=1 Tax=Polarella glacialis TaxID=89957 RepID=A0A813FCZ5_POLGL|nr:unnamed protein product [Polarella glacialis]
MAKVRPSDDEVMAFPDREVGHAPPTGDPHVLGGFCMEPEDQESSLQRGPGLLRKSNNNKLPADLATRSEESKPYGTFCYSRISCGCLVALLAGSVHVATWSLSTAFAGQKLLPLFRGLGLALLCLPIYRFGSSFWGEAFAGPAADRRFCCGLTLAATTVCLLTPFITEWLGTGTPSTMLMVSAGAMVLVFGSFGLLLQQRRRGTLRQSFVTHLLWGSSSIVLSFGIWLALYLVAIGYVVSLSSKNSILSAILLPLSTAFLEILNVCLANWFFRRWIFKPRLVGNPGAAVGDQRLNVVPCLVAWSHGFAESTRVAATVAGAIRSRSYIGIVSISVAVVVNAFTRSGWFRFMFIRATTNIQKWMKKVGMLKRTICPVEWFAPTVFSKLHDEVKFSLGYPRFAGLGALIAGRCLTKLVTTMMNLQPLAFDMRAVRPGLVVAAASLCFKVAEDLLLTKLDKNVHSPIGPVAMRYYMGLHLEDPWQILAVSNVGKVQDTLVSDSRISYLKSCRTQASLAETARSSSDKLTSGVAGSVDPTVGGMVRRYWGQSLTIHHARGLHGLRLVGLQVQVGLTATCACFTIILMELLVGPTILYGMCPEPVSLEASLLQVLFWNRSPQCE